MHPPFLFYCDFNPYLMDGQEKWTESNRATFLLLRYARDATSQA